MPRQKNDAMILIHSSKSVVKVQVACWSLTNLLAGAVLIENIISKYLVTYQSIRVQCC